MAQELLEEKRHFVPASAIAFVVAGRFDYNDAQIDAVSALIAEYLESAKAATAPECAA